MAVPLPPSFQEDVEACIERLPTVSVVAQLDADREDDEHGFSYVPIDPCQGVIAALRTAMGERIAREFIDMETPRFEAVTGVFPDPYALKRVSPERFAAAVLPAIPPPRPGQHAERIAWMAARLRELESRHRLILLVCSLLDWPWIRDAYHAPARVARARAVLRARSDLRRRSQDPDLRPRRAALHHGAVRARAARADARRQPLGRRRQGDGARGPRPALKREHPKVAQRITPQLLSIYFRYVRNLSLIDRRLTPDLYSLVIAAKQTAGDDFALAVAETARDLSRAPVASGTAGRGSRASPASCGWGIDRAEVPGWGTARDGQPAAGPGVSLAVVRAAARARWSASSSAGGSAGTPSACAPGRPRTTGSRASTATSATRPGRSSAPTWPASEKFTTSVRDGIDIRETLRNWHTGDLYVKVAPAEPGRDRGGRLPLRRPGRPAGLHATAPPGTPSTPRNRRWPSTPPTP